jgi:hypothetical protein
MRYNHFTGYNKAVSSKLKKKAGQNQGKFRGFAWLVFGSKIKFLIKNQYNVF